MLYFFPRDVLDEIWALIESVSKGFSTYSSTLLGKTGIQVSVIFLWYVHESNFAKFGAKIVGNPKTLFKVSERIITVRKRAEKKEEKSFKHWAQVSKRGISE